ncbi:TetR/AcrR family transcriptional regulator [Saccharopolyspora taberi]|uniref:TetR/AcrR family transcriptional regulator n=1 Tax=Saccharopolyspora taberi TaxID=60895 RepID=A0ABN3VCV9_9PSEU
MPRQVDHQARRKLIAEALWRVARQRGMDAVSMRHVATEAGVSVGMVQHYFRTKDQMLSFALETIGERVAERIGARLAELPGDCAPVRRVRAMLLELLPLDAARHLEAHVGFAFFTRAAVEPGLATRLREQYPEFVGFVAAEVGRARGDLDADREARALMALVDGLAAHVLVGYESPEGAAEVLEGRLAEVFGG